MDGRFRRVATVEYQASLGDANKFPHAMPALKGPPKLTGPLRGPSRFKVHAHDSAWLNNPFLAQEEVPGSPIGRDYFHALEPPAQYFGKPVE